MVYGLYLHRKFPVVFKNFTAPESCHKMPKKLSFFESSIRTVLKEYVQRGKVDVFITYEDTSSILEWTKASQAFRKVRSKSCQSSFSSTPCSSIVKAKMGELLENSTIDDSRIAAEVTIFADKMCVDEETVRLRSHIESTRTALLEGGSIGRKLDFIAQEMNREANTILSKSNDLQALPVPLFILLCFPE